MEAQALSFSFTFFIYVYYLAWAILGAIGSVWIYRDAKKLPKLFLGSRPVWWAVATIVLGPIWVFLAYWLIHHSTISNRITNDGEKN